MHELQNRMGLTPTRKSTGGSQLEGTWWMASGVCSSTQKPGRTLGVTWSAPIMLDSLPRRSGRDRDIMLETGFRSWAEAQSHPQWNSLSWLNLEVQSSWQGDSSSKRSLNSDSSIQMKTRVCSKSFSSKRIKKSCSPCPTFAVRDQQIA